MPEVSITWTKKLLELRKKILNRRKAIEKVKDEKRNFVIDGEEIELPTDEDNDDITKELKNYGREVEQVKDLITNRDRNNIVVVMNPDELSLFETERAMDTLSDFEITLRSLIVNEFEGKSSQDEILEKVKSKFDLPITKIPKLDQEPMGMDKIDEFIKYIEDEKWLTKK